MEGVCDLFNADDSDTTFESKTYKLQPLIFQCHPELEADTEIFEMDGKQDNVLIGEAHWKGSRVFSKWLSKKFKDQLQGKNILELGSGPGLCGFVAANLGANSVVLTDYKPQVMELIAYNIRHFKKT